MKFAEMLAQLPSCSIASLLLFSSIATAVNLDCHNIQVDKRKWDLSSLGGPHSIIVQDTEGHPSMSNTTWTIDICQALKKPKNVPKEDSCPSYTRVCGVKKTWNPIDDPDVKHPIISDVIGVAGTYDMSHGGALEPQITRLKTTDKEIEGLDIELHGGRYNDRKQKAVVSFICAKDMTGNEGNEDAEDKQLLRARKDEEESDDDDDSDDGDKKPGDRFKQDPKSALQFVSYQEEEVGKDKYDVLRMSWKTKYACEDSDIADDTPAKGGWGFFTWFILLAFLGIAAYLIFGSWLNYNRYGARGWDLLPHGDTIRDVPYLFKDWSRKVVDTVTGGNSRGGYSAV